MSSAAGSYGGGLRHLQRLENEQRTKVTRTFHAHCVYYLQGPVGAFLQFTSLTLPNTTRSRRGSPNEIGIVGNLICLGISDGDGLRRPAPAVRGNGQD